ncbi:hypothetical protein E6R60_35820 [Streptomyces sp. A0642]|uniref:CU044_5270 family protein n=1 Tax=Streptomyces sp. A0642 TaxID=2563100 RepID=UPI0010A20FFE|nr:CU044_5270 family protein [Streptomyces sp. A0642]THA62144.1 hypothetical protein E6R60_35820 [Streptomyces sp. A0642]
MNTPTGFKQRLGAELAVLERARAERAAEETSRADAPVTARRVLARPGVRRTAWAGLAACTVATALVATSGGRGTQTAPVRTMTVAQVLDAAALNAAQGPDEKPGTHQWVYTRTVVCMDDCVRDPSWKRYDGAEHAFLRTSGTGSRPAVVVEDLNPQKPEKVGDRPRDTREALSRLPTDPRELLARVSTDPFFGAEADPLAALRHSEARPEPPAADTPGAQFARILYILQNEPSIPPRINAALYRALALIPGTELVGTPMRDAAGRPGLTIAFDVHDRLHTREYLFLDARTYAYHGTRTDRNSGRLLSASRLAVGIVDHPGQFPGGTAPDPSRVVRESVPASSPGRGPSADAPPAPKTVPVPWAPQGRRAR